jgi:hypothetical protein
MRVLRNARAHAITTHAFFLQHISATRAKLRRQSDPTTTKIFFSADAKIARAKRDLRKIAQNCVDTRATRRAENRLRTHRSAREKISNGILFHHASCANRSPSALRSFRAE